MKSRGIAPVVVTHTDGNGTACDRNLNNNNNYKYIRALLGINSHVKYMDTDRRGIIINIKHNVRNSESKIERMQSPVFFKIVNKHIFICTNSKCIESIYGKEFRFEQRNNRNRAGNLIVPTAGELRRIEFSLDKLLSEYVRYYNGASPGESGRYLRAGEASNGEIRDYALAPDVLRDNKYVHKVEEAGNE